MDLMRGLKKIGITKGSITLKSLLKHFSIKHKEENQHEAWSDTENLIKVAHKAANSCGFPNYGSFLCSYKHFIKSIYI